MKIIFSEHALLKIGQRKLPKVFILKTIKYPDSIRPNKSHREARYKKFTNYYMKVIVLKKIDKLIVITAHWVSKIK